MNAAIFVRADAPACMTSSWLRALREMPAARLETSEMPAIFMPQALANTASGKNISVEEPAGTITCRDHHAFVSAHYGNGFNTSVDAPAPTLTCKDRLGLVTSNFLEMQYGNGTPASTDEPAPAVRNEDGAEVYVALQSVPMAGSRSNVGKLLLGHFSKRFLDEKPLLDEARAVFPNSFLAKEGLVMDV